MTLFVTIIGLLVVAATLRDVVHELFHPERTGSMSRLVMRGVWRGMRFVGRWWRGALDNAGAALIVAVAAMWTSLVVVGFALVYWPRLPAAYHVQPGVPPDAARGFLTALYVSLGTLSTLGAPDLAPIGGALRILTTLESLFGVVLITAWITWVLSIYPVLAQRRAFAREVALLRRAEATPAMAAGEAPREAVAEVLRSLTEQLMLVDAQLAQSTVTYYFHHQERELSLAVQLPWVLEYARAAERAEGGSAVRHRGTLLRLAVEQVLANVADQFLDVDPAASPETIIAAMARDHRR